MGPRGEGGVGLPRTRCMAAVSLGDAASDKWRARCPSDAGAARASNMVGGDGTREGIVRIQNSAGR